MAVVQKLCGNTLFKERYGVSIECSDEKWNERANVMFNTHFVIAINFFWQREAFSYSFV